MRTPIGIDVGISITRIVGIREGKIVKPLCVKATDPATSLCGTFGKYLYDDRIDLSDVKRVMLTGVGARYVDRPVCGLPTAEVDEFLADGLGAQFESRLQRMIVVSVGTGTSLVPCDNNEVRHIDGIGTGGGTLSSLPRLLLQTDNINEIIALANRGDISHINLQIKDISTSPPPGLPMDATISLFANAQVNASRGDIALDLIGLVLQSIGSATILSFLNSGIHNFVLIGNLSLLPQCELPFPVIEKTYDVHLTIPKGSEYCTAIDTTLQTDNIETVQSLFIKDYRHFVALSTKCP